MGYDSGSSSEDGRDDDEEEEYEDVGGGNRFLGFMFGNVDNSGDLDIDYLDEDAKEHLAALADTLGSSLTDIDLSVKSSRAPGDAAEQDYDEKAEDAVDYEDIDEQYEGPEILAAGEEDYLLPRNKFFSAEASFATVESKASVFDDENYDDDEEFEKEQEGVESTVEVESNSSQGAQGEFLAVASEGEKYFENDLQLGSLDAEKLAADLEEFQEEETEVLKGPLDGKGSAPLPILCIEDGMVILRFSEIFGIHEPLKRGEKRDRRHFNAKEIKYVEASDIVEDDEEAFLKESGRGFSFMKHSHATQHDVSDGDSELANFGFVQGAATDAMEYDKYRKDSCLREEPMKEDSKIDPSVGWSSPLSPKFYPLDQEDWEDRIVWDNSPEASDNFVESCEISGPDVESLVIRGTQPETEPQNLQTKPSLEQDEKDFPFFLHGSAGLLEPFGSRNSLGPTDLLLESSYHPQLLRLESRFEVDASNHEDGKDTATDELCRSDTLRRFSKLALQNRDILEGSWLDKIIWEPYKPIAKPKLILDLQDEQMLFEILDNVDGKNLTLHAGAMVITRSTKSSTGDSLELPGHGGQSGWRFNIANDKFYSNRKTSQQQRLTSKKRVGHGIKVHHSIPALKLETMKLKLSNKDIANFHRPKALWYPHDNELAVKEQGKLPTQGPMKIILKSLGGKGSKIHVDSEETLSSVKAKASKKLDFKPSESVKIFYSGKALDDNKSLVAQNVQPNSLLHLVRTKVHLLPRAQKLPGENKSLRPPGAFKKKSDLSMKDGHAFLMEYCEERPLMLSNVGMGARLCTYYQKSSPGDQTGTLLHNGNSSLGSVLTLDPADKSPFLGDLRGGFSQSSLETNMYRAPVFPHKVPATDYLLVRSAKGKLSIRRIDRIHVVGQQEPLVEVMSPGAKTLQSYLMNRLFVYVCREFRAIEKRGMLPTIRADDVSGQFPGLSENNIRKRLKELAAWQRSSSGQWLYVMKRSARIPSEEELRKLVLPENVCAYESMQAGVYRLKHLGITRLTHPAGISSAMSQLPDEAITLAAASHIERELQITPWNLSSNFVACINQGRENIERLEISGVGDPSGRGLGFSYVRTAPKAPMSSAMVKKKTAAGRGGSTVTGTDADLRRLSMEAAREVLLKFNVPEEMIAKQTRWHRIAMIRKLSSEQAASGVKVDPTTISKYARGQRMSFLQLQQQTREKCQEIWDRQVQSLSAVDGDENESDSEADLDSFAGDLENLLDAEECEEGEEGNYESMPDKADGVKGLKMRRRPSQAQAEEEIEDEAAEAAELFRMLMDDDEAERRRKKRIRAVGEDTGLASGLQSSFGFENAERSNKSGRIIKQIVSTAQPDGSYTSKDNITRDPREFESFLAKRNVSGKMKAMKDNDIARMGLPNKKVKILSDGVKIFKEKKSARERFVCGACGQLGHMRTNKNCPKYREDTDKQLETTNLEKASGKSNSLDPSSQSLKTLNKKPIPKSATKLPLVEATEGEKSSSKANVPPVKFKCGSADKISDKVACGPAESSEQPVTSDAESGKKSVKVNKIKFSNKKKPEDVQGEYQKPAIVFRPPTDTDRGPVESHKPSIVLRPPIVVDRDQVESHKPSIVLRPPAEIDREQPHKKIIIKRSKEIIDLDQVSQDGSTSHQSRKIKKIVELSSFEKNGKYESTRLTEESTKSNAREDRRWWEEEEKKRYAERHKEEKARRLHEERKRMLEEQERFSEIKRYEEAIRREWEEEELQKAAKKKKKKRPEIRESYLEDQRARRNDRRMPERDRSAKRRPVSELGRYGTESTAATKRRRGGEVGLANILERIVEALKDRYEVSYLFLKPVAKKEAPDYLDIIERPMDLSTIREKVRKMEYSDREGFRHDVWQITYNAHRYNDGRNPGIPPLADQLLEICDYLLSENDESLTEAEESIRYRDT